MERFITETRLVPVEFDPFNGSPIERTIPSTEAQREVFIASLMGKEASCAYNESVSLELIGTLDRAALEKAFAALIARHEGLRSVISADGTRVIVHDRTPFVLAFTDLGGRNDNERKKELDAIATADMTTAFDLVNGPLFRARLIKLPDNTHLLRLTGHHVICDGWSLGIIMADISRLYSGGKLDTAIPLSDYTLAVIDFAHSDEHTRVERYWLDQFKGRIPRLDLPTDRTRPRQKTYNGRRIDVEMDPTVVRGLREVATRSGASFVTSLLASFELLLHKLTEQDDLVVGLPAAGQSDFGMKHLVAHCVNLLALRSHIDDQRSFVEHLKERRTAMLDAFDHQKYTFGTLVRTLNVPREPGRIPLCPVVFNIDMNMDDGVSFTGLKHRFISNPRRYENFELFLNATGNEDKLVLEWSYNTDLFDESTVRGWMEELTRIISRVNLNATASIADLIGESTLASDAQLPPEEWLGTSPHYPRDKSIAQLWDEAVVRFGSNTALELVDQRLSYRDLDERVHGLTTLLLEAGVRPGDPVGLCVERGFEMVTAMLAVLRCGAAFVPFDPAYPSERLRFMFDDTQVRVLLTQRSMKDVLPPHTARTILLDEHRPSNQAPTPALGSPGSPAYIMYTSGSTGRPKGVVIPQRAIVRLVKAQNYLPFGPELTFLQLSNISFDASTLEIWGALLNGGRLVLQPQQKPTLLEITETIREKGVTSVWFTAGLFNLLVDDHLDKLRGLKHILTGGDVLSVPHVKKALKALGPGVLINGYGPTENTTFTCCYKIDDEARIKGSVPIGHPIAHTRVHVLNEALRPVAIGQKGELYAGGDGVATGYWRRDDLDRERFIDDPFSSTPGARLYKTGDIVRWNADGLLEFIGRADDQVKVRGFRIELGEIENALNAHALVKDRVVVVRSDLPGEKQLVCYVVPHASQTSADPEAQEQLIGTVREHLRNRLPEHMIPSAFVVMESFPLNPNGKVDKKALPVPQYKLQTLRAHHVGPRDHMERMLTSIWSQLLGAEKIGVHDNFFDLGGHSLIAIQLLDQVEAQLGKALSLDTLFKAPTIAEFARLLQDEGAVVKWRNLSPIQPEGRKVPFFCVHGDEANYFIPRYLGNDQPFYAFFHQGDDGRAIPYTKVEDIAAHFIREMRTVRPRGPYLLGGFSFGGIVAFEMAQQLTAVGEEVPVLALFDTSDPVEYVRDSRVTRKFHEPLKNWIIQKIVQGILKNGKVLPPRLRHYYIIDTYDKAIRAYDAKPYTGPITVFKAQTTKGVEHMGWERLAKGQVEVVHVPGTHYDLIKEPHVKTLVAELSSTIDRGLSKHAVEAV